MMSFRQSQAVKMPINLLRDLVAGKVDYLAKDKAKEETMLPMPLWRNQYGENLCGIEKAVSSK